MTKQPEQQKKAKPPREPDYELLGNGHCTDVALKNYIERDLPGWQRRQAEQDD